MKSFFKKLAFVMALAMVVSMVAPAATTASAAEEMKIGYQNGAVITELNLTEARSSEDLKAVGAPSNWKELGINWVSSNPAVATVDNAGVVTAVSAGTADIMVTCGDATATITVNCLADAKAYDVTIGTADERSITEKTLKVGDEFDFAFFGVKDYGRDKVNNAPRYFCEWDSTDTAVATVDKNGLVKAVAPGKAKITLIVWNLATGTKHNVTPTWVTVEEDKPAVVEPTMVAEQTAEDGVKLTFENIDVTKEALEAGLKAYYMINDTKVEHIVAVKEVKDGVAKVTSYANFIEGVTYIFEYEGMETSFVAYIGKAVSIVGSYKCDELDIANKAYTNYNTKISYKLYNEKGMEITDCALAGTASVEISLVNEAYDGSFTLDTYNRSIYFTQAGKVANIKMEYFTGEVNTAGQRVVGATSVLPIVSEKEPAYTMAKVNWYNLSDWRGNTTLSVDEIYNKVSLVISFTDTKYAEVRTDSLTLTEHIGGHFTYKTTKDSVVSVDALGQLTPNAPGTANILVYYDNDLLDTTAGNVVAVIPVTVIGNRVVSNISQTQKSVSNTIASFATAADVTAAGKDVTGLNFNQAEYTFWIADQLWKGKDANNVTLTLNGTLPTGVGKLDVSMYGTTYNYSGNTITLPAGGWFDLVFTADPGVLGNASSYTYSYTFKADGVTSTFAITVKKPNYDKNNNVLVQGYSLETWGGNQKDIKVVDNADNVATVAFYEVSNGAHVGIVDVAANYDVTTYTKGNYYFTVSGLQHGHMADTAEMADRAAALKAAADKAYWDAEWAVNNNADLTQDEKDAELAELADVRAASYAEADYLLTVYNQYAVRVNTVNGIEIPLATVNTDYYGWQLAGTATPGALSVPKYVNKNVNGTDTYSIAIYRATADGTNGKLQVAAQTSISVTDTQEKLTYVGKQQNYYDNAKSGNTNTIEDLVMKSFKFNFDGAEWSKDYHYWNANNQVKFAVVYNVNDGTGTNNNGGSFLDGEVYYINKVYFYVPVDGDGDGDFTYVQYIVDVNDYVVIK